MEKIIMGNERIHFRSPNINVCYLVSIKGDFSDSQFEKAVEAVSKRHNMLTCVLETDERNNIWYLFGKSKPSLEIYNDSKITDWIKWYEKTDNHPFDFDSGPLVKFCIVKKEDVTDVIILGHHIIGDGIGYLNLLRDFLLALDARLDTAPLKPVADNYLETKSGLGLISSFFARGLNKSWRKSSKHFTHQEYVNLFNRYRQIHVPSMHISELNESELERLIAKCKESGVTVNETISTAFIKALQQIDSKYSNKELRFGVAANIRSEMKVPVVEGMCNYTTGISIKIGYDNCKGFTENVKIMAQKLRAKLKNPKYRYEVVHFLNILDKDFIESAFFAAYDGFNNPSSKKLAKVLGETTDEKGIGISNLGLQDIGHFNTFEVTNVLFIPPAFPANVINIGVITIKSRLNLCLRYSKPEISDSFVEKLCNAALDECRK